MPSWVEKKARADAFYWSHAAETWRQLKDCIEQAVYDWTRIYSPVGVQEVECSSCPETNENCIRVRTIPNPGQQEKYIELRFRPNDRLIQSGSHTFKFTVEGERAEARLILKSKHDECERSVEDLCRFVVEPLFETFGPRKPLNLHSGQV